MPIRRWWRRPLSRSGSHASRAPNGPRRDAAASGHRLQRTGAKAIALLAVMASSLTVGAGRALAAYISPFKLNVSAPQSWFSDIATRTALIHSHSTPDPAHWYSTTYPAFSWGPANPQLFAVAANQIVDPTLVSNLQSDRGIPVYNTPINQVAAGETYLNWATQRLMGVAQSMIGTAYQHLHLPDFDPALVSPPGSFSWSEVSNKALLQSSQQLLAGQPGTQANPYQAQYGVPAPGIDCTDFTAYLYNLALGYQLHSGVINQVEFLSAGGLVGGKATATVVDDSGRAVQPSFFYGPNYGIIDAINAPGSLNNLIDELQPGDLLYIGNKGAILHVVMWLGPIGLNLDGSPSSVPLVISSHDNTPAIFDTQDIVMDASSTAFGFPTDGQIETHLPPPGVHILPFTSENWFYQDFQLAMRVLPSQPVPAPALPAWAVLAMAQRLRRLARRQQARDHSRAGSRATPRGSP